MLSLVVGACKERPGCVLRTHCDPPVLPVPRRARAVVGLCAPGFFPLVFVYSRVCVWCMPTYPARLCYSQWLAPAPYRCEICGCAECVPNPSLLAFDETLSFDSRVCCFCRWWWWWCCKLGDKNHQADVATVKASALEAAVRHVTEGARYERERDGESEKKWCR